MNYVLENFDANLALIREHGYDMMDRTGVGCRYLPGIVTEVDISERVPIPTRRKTAWKSMLKEYLWFLTGSDRIGDLNKMGSKVWDAWAKPEWAKNRGFDEDSIGYGYGPNLIRFGQPLEKVPEDPYYNEVKETMGFNQVDHVIDLLKNNPQSRRILFSFFRPDRQGSEHVALDPCHLIYQFIPEPNNRLSCCVYIRSNDMFVGALSTNLQGAAFYTHMIAQQTEFKPSKLIVMSAHAHIYHNHFDGVDEYLSREKPNSPILVLNRCGSIYDYTAADFTLSDYNPLPKITVDVAV